jgi:hypothetical protein
MRRCRCVAEVWIERLTELLCSISGGTKQFEDLQAVRLRLGEVALYCILTFTSEQDSVRAKLLSGKVDVVSWLRAVTTARDQAMMGSADLERHQQAGLKVHVVPVVHAGYLAVLRGLAGHTALLLEEMLHTQLASCKEGALDCFTRIYWPGADDSEAAGGWWRCSEGGRWYEGRYGAVVVHVDVVWGDFKVNGTPVGRLPDAITGHTKFRRLFKDAVLDVQLASVTWAGETVPGYVTVWRIHGAYFKFAARGRQSASGEPDLWIIEETPCNEVTGAVTVSAFLLDSGIFGIDLAHGLAEDHGHWLTVYRDRALVAFRPSAFDHPAFARNRLCLVPVNKSSQNLVVLTGACETLDSDTSSSSSSSCQVLYVLLLMYPHQTDSSLTSNSLFYCVNCEMD